MPTADIRDVEVWSPTLESSQAADGSLVIRRTDPLGDYPRHMSEKMLHWAQVAPDRTWMAQRGADGAWIRITYAQLVQQVMSIAQHLLDLGLSPDRPVMILSENSLKHAVLALAAQHVGIPSAAISPAYALASGDFSKLDSIVKQISPGLVFVNDAAPFAKALADTIPADVVVTSDGAAASDHRHVAWADLLATPVSDAVAAAHGQTTPDTVAKFLFTSGTTGAPKAVIQTQRMLCSNMAQVQDCYAFMRKQPPVFVDWAPWNHTASGNKVFNMTIYSGGTYYIDSGKPTPTAMAETIRNLREISPTWYFNVPAGYEMLLEAMEDDPQLRSRFFAEAKMLMYAGAGLSARLWDQLKSVARDTIGQEILLTTGLGSTETGPFALCCTEPQEVPGNIGIPAQGIEMKLVPTAGKLEVRLKGPNITPGYWRDPKTTAEAFDEDGFYRMGDALRFAVPGDLYRGFYFDGRIAENFKLATGTWVAVGNVRAELVDALGGVARDVVIAGEGENELAALLIPFRPAIERIVPGGEGMDDATLFAHPAFHAELTTQLQRYGASVSGSSRRVARVMVLGDPPDPKLGELTEKGSVNQRAVLRNRAEAVAQLYSDAPQVILTRPR